MAALRIMPYHESPDFEATRTFYTRVLGLEEGNFGGTRLCTARSTSPGASAASSSAIRTVS